MSLEIIYRLKAFQLYHCPDNNAKSVVKHLIFLRKFAVILDITAPVRSHYSTRPASHCPSLTALVP